MKKKCGERCNGVGCTCACHRLGGASGMKDEAERMLLTWPKVKCKPTHHPYYWMGRRDAAKELLT